MDNLRTTTEQLVSADEEVRRKALSCLSTVPFPEAKEHLFRAMGDESWRVRKEAVDVFLSFSGAAAAADGLVGLLRSHDNAGLRNSAVEALTKLGAASVSVLHKYAGDPDHDVRKFVIDIIGSIGHVSSVPILLQSLEDPDANVCAAAAENLGKLRDKRAVPCLVQALSKQDVWLRYTILEALASIGEPVSMAVMEQLARENLLKKAVFDCLGSIGGMEAASLLVEGLKEKLKNAREAAVASLMKIRDKVGSSVAEKEIDPKLKGLKGSPYVEGIVALLQTSDMAFREAVVRILAIIGDERTSGELLKGCRDENLSRLCVQAFKNMGNPGLSSLMDAYPAAAQEDKCFIVYLCGEIGFSGSASVLKEGMRSGYPLLKRASAVAAGKIGLTEAIGDIALLLDDRDPEVQEGAIESLARLGQKDPDAVLKIARRLVVSEDAGHRKNAAILFSAIRDGEKLSQLLKDEHADVRKSAVDGLAHLKDHATLGHLVYSLTDEDPDVRVAVASALGEIGGEPVLGPLILALRDEDPWVVCSAVKSLGKIGGEKALSAVLSMAASAEGMIMIAVLEALDKIGGAKAADVVTKALSNPDEEVVKAAMDILSRQRGDDWIELNKEMLLNHPHWDVRISFVRILAGRLGKRAIPYLNGALDRENDEMVKAQINEQIGRLNNAF